MLALDVSGSMSARVSGMEFLDCREASAAMALVTAASRAVPHVHGLHGGKLPVALVAEHRKRAVDAGHLAEAADGRRGEGDQRPAVWRNRLCAADARGA